MTLVEKLKQINKTPVIPLQNGFAEKAEDFGNNFIFPRLPKREVALQWHKVLTEYVTRPNATFALRFYNSALPSKYETLRRGFLTRTDKGYSFFYTDNFHAAYYFKMALDDFVPSVDEIISAYSSRQFPARFGPVTSEEREFAAMPNEYNPGFTIAGYKIAHIHNVGTDYYSSGKNFSLSDVVEKYFPRGERTDWSERTDSHGKYYLRDLAVNDDAKKYLVAEFLRFVHPFNYFLMPIMIGKNSRAVWAHLNRRKDAAEYLPLLDFVRNKFAEIYGEAYEEFLDLIMVDRENLDARSLQVSGDLSLKILYGITFTKIEEEAVSNPARKITPKIPADFPEEIKLAVLKEYLRNPKTSLRKLEMKIMQIESPVRGGGFKAKTIVNSYGALNDNKGLLAKCSVEDALKSVDGQLRETLLKYKGYLES